MTQKNSRRPVARALLFLIQIASLATAFLAAYSLGVGLWPEARAAGGAHYAIPFLVGAAVALLLAVGWHVALSLAAHSRLLHEYVIATCFGPLRCRHRGVRVDVSLRRRRRCGYT